MNAMQRSLRTLAVALTTVAAVVTMGAGTRPVGAAAPPATVVAMTGAGSLLRCAAQPARLAWHRRQVGEVGARAERSRHAGDDDDGGALVGTGLPHGFDEVEEHRVRHRVALLGAIDGDRADLAVDVVANVLGHAPTVLFNPPAG